MIADYELVGFDRRTSFAEEFHPLPPETVAAAMQAAGLSPEVAALAGDWPVSDDAARQIAAMMGATIDTTRMEYFLAPYAPLPAEASRAAE